MVSPAASILEVENRITHRWSKLIIPTPRSNLVHRLRKCLTETDPETGELVFIDHDPMGRARLEAYVRIDPCGRVILTVYGVADGKTANGARLVPLGAFALELLNERSPGLSDERAGE